METPLRILVVEDHPDVAANIGDFLSARGHVLDFASNGRAGCELALADRYDAVILDVMLPRMDGLTVCRKLREAGCTTPVLMLSARDQLEDTLDGFEAGSDDYLTKPFSLLELEARVKVLVRRNHRHRSAVLRVADLELDLGTRTARRDGQPLALTAGMRKVLTELMRASPNLVTRERLEVVLWGEDVPGDDALRAQVYALRRVVDRPFARSLIHTVHGVGYRLYDAAPTAD